MQRDQCDLRPLPAGAERDDRVKCVLKEIIGVYTSGHDARDKPRFQRVKAPERTELEQLVHTISERTGRYLERQGLLVRDLGNSHLALEPQDDTGLEGVLGSSITSATAPALLYLLHPCSRTVLPWARTRDARPSACKPCLPRAAWKRPVPE